MTDIVYTHAFDTEDSSSVIDEVYYSEPDKLLFVKLTNGVLTGYDDVPLNAYTSLETLNANRLDGNGTASVGRYWNMWIKPHFPGFNTSDVELVSQTEANKTVNAIHGTPVEQADDKGQYDVTFADDKEDEFTLSVMATSIDDAVDRFRQAEKVLGWPEAQIISVTKFFV